MAGGRTTWWPKDAAWHRRELLIELGEEFGAEGPHLIDVLSAWAQEQGASGHVKGGWLGVKREAFVPVERAKAILQRAAEIGVIDDLQVNEDGRRFECRVSGWAADSRRGRAAWRKADQRDRERGAAAGEDVPPEPAPEQGEGAKPVTERDMSRSVTESAPQDRTGQEKEQPRGRAVAFAGQRVAPSTLEVAVAIVERFNELAETTYRPFRDDSKPSENLKRVLGALRADRRVGEPGVAERMIAAAFSGRRFWEPARPHLGHVFGEGVRDVNLEAALAAAVPGVVGVSAADRMVAATRRATAEAERQFAGDDHGAQAA